MKLLRTKARLVLCVLIVIAFFIPAYKGISGFTFITMALSEASPAGEVTITDVVVVLAPLVLIPLSALMILIRSLKQLSTRKTYKLLPLLFLAFFFFIILVSTKHVSTDLNGPGAIFDMQVGFYLAAVSSFLLVFTKNTRRSRVKKVEPETDTLAAG